MFSKWAEIPDATALKIWWNYEKMCISWNTHPIGPCTSVYACQCWESFICILQSQASKNVFPPLLIPPYPGWHWCPQGRYHGNENIERISNIPKVESPSLPSSNQNP